VKYTSPVYSAASGSVGGLTYSHNKGGQYTRTRNVPTNPNSAFQQVIRSLVSQLTDAWANILTPVQRTAWNNYAANVSMLNTLGQSIKLSGLNHYVRSNVPRIQAGLARIDPGPTIFNLGDYTPFTFTSIAAATGIISIAFTNTDDWANENNAALLLYGSKPQQDTIEYFKGPYRFAGRVNGSSGSPPASPGTWNSPYAYAVGQVCHTRLQVVRADGRLSADQRLFLAAT
jgi:hypothetical protein